MSPTVIAVKLAGMVEISAFRPVRSHDRVPAADEGRDQIRSRALQMPPSGPAGNSPVPRTFKIGDLSEIIIETRDSTDAL